MHNIFVDSPNNLRAIKQAFKENDRYRKKRKNEIGMYHEVIAFHPDDTKILTEHPEKLENIARIYFRAPDSQAIACPHFDKDHVHLHVMISLNEVNSSKSIRISKNTFQAIRRNMEAYHLAHYPELSFYVHSRDRNRYENQEKEIQENKRSHKEWQLDERNGDKSQNEKVASLVEEVLAENKVFSDAQKSLGE